MPEAKEKMIPRDIGRLLETAKRGELSPADQIAFARAYELWHEMAIRCEATIHRLTK